MNSAEVFVVVVANEPREQDKCVVATLGGLALGVFLDDELLDDELLDVEHVGGIDGDDLWLRYDVDEFAEVEICGGDLVFFDF